MHLKPINQGERELDALGTKNIVNVIDGSVAVGDLLLDANSPQAYSDIPRAINTLAEKGTTFSGESIEIANTNFEGNDIWVTADGHYFSRYPFSIWYNSSSATEDHPEDCSCYGDIQGRI